MPRVTKKSVIREYLERERPAQVGRAEAAAIRRALAQVLGPRGRISDDYLLSVLDELGARAAAEIGGISPEARALLQYDTLEHAEAMLRALEERRRSGDAEAAADAKRAAVLVCRHSELISRNPRVAPAKRALKEEVARWCSVWLQTPDLFFDWLELRKRELPIECNQ